MARDAHRDHVETVKTLAKCVESTITRISISRFPGARPSGMGVACQHPIGSRTYTRPTNGTLGTMGP